MSVQWQVSTSYEDFDHWYHDELWRRSLFQYYGMLCKHTVGNAGDTKDISHKGSHHVTSKTRRRWMALKTSPKGSIDLSSS
jgi:hypothetical protein